MMGVGRELSRTGSPALSASHGSPYLGASGSPATLPSSFGRGGWESPMSGNRQRFPNPPPMLSSPPHLPIRPDQYNSDELQRASEYYAQMATMVKQQQQQQQQNRRSQYSESRRSPLVSPTYETSNISPTSLYPGQHPLSASSASSASSPSTTRAPYHYQPNHPPPSGSPALSAQHYGGNNSHHGHHSGPSSHTVRSGILEDFRLSKAKKFDIRVRLYLLPLTMLHT